MYSSYPNHNIKCTRCDKVYKSIGWFNRHVNACNRKRFPGSASKPKVQRVKEVLMGDEVNTSTTTPSLKQPSLPSIPAEEAVLVVPPSPQPGDERLTDRLLRMRPFGPPADGFVGASMPSSNAKRFNTRASSSTTTTSNVEVGVPDDFFASMPVRPPTPPVKDNKDTSDDEEWEIDEGSSCECTSEADEIEEFPEPCVHCGVVNDHKSVDCQLHMHSCAVCGGHLYDPDHLLYNRFNDSGIDRCPKVPLRDRQCEKCDSDQHPTECCQLPDDDPMLKIDKSLQERLARNATKNLARRGKGTLYRFGHPVAPQKRPSEEAVKRAVKVIMDYGCTFKRTPCAGPTCGNDIYHNYFVRPHRTVRVGRGAASSNVHFCSPDCWKKSKRGPLPKDK